MNLKLLKIFDKEAGKLSNNKNTQLELVNAAFDRLLENRKTDKNLTPKQIGIREIRATYKRKKRKRLNIVNFTDISDDIDELDEYIYENDGVLW